MIAEIPVAGSLPRTDAHVDPLVVEADPEGAATRSVKDVARHVYRLIQEFDWAGHEGAVVVGVSGGTKSSIPIGPNVALLLAPLVRTAIGERAGAMSADELLDAARYPIREHAEGIDAFVSPRDRVWIVPDASLRDPGTRNLFELVILEGPPDRPLDDVDVLLAVTAYDELPAIPPGLREDAELAAVLVGGPEEHPPTVAVGD